MKSFFTLIILSVSLFACKKDYTCTCKFGNKERGFYRTEDVAQYSNVTKSSANNSCLNYARDFRIKNPGVNSGSDSIIVCNLK